MNTHWTFQFQNTSSRREDLTATDMGNLQETENYYLANNLKKFCIKRVYKGIHDRFLRDHEFPIWIMLIYSLKRRFFSSGSFVYVFEDIEAVIIKGRSPTMRHVSRTHRVALEWLFDRINLDPKIQIKYIDTKNNSKTY